MPTHGDHDNAGGDIRAALALRTVGSFCGVGKIVGRQAPGSCPVHRASTVVYLGHTDYEDYSTVHVEVGSRRAPYTRPIYA